MERIYAASPVWLQQVGINVYGLFRKRRRLGPVFEQTWRAYAQRESWPADRMQEYVEAQLRAQVQRAYREVPLYRQAFRKYGVSDEVIDRFTLADLPKLPFLEKSVVRANPAALLTEKAARNPPQEFSTSGTTGTPIRVYWDTGCHQHNLGVREARSYRWAGVSIRQSRAGIGGRLVVPRAHSRPPFWRYNRWEQQLYLSAFHISPANVRDYVAALNRFKPVTMTGYASANFFLARLIGELGLEVHSPRAIITESERLEPHMRAALETVFGARAYEEYGSVENCALATECERGRLHVHVDFGYVEILRPDGQPAAPGEIGEMFLTGFANTNQIFIRYRIGDLAAWATDPCPCGRSTLPVLGDLAGRLEDTVITGDGREVWGLFRVFYDLPGVAEGQVVQEALDRFVVNVVPTASYSESDVDAIRARMVARLGLEINVEIRKLDAIPREPNGKVRAVISRVRRRPAAG
jgi:phenylacetate-CoA ligase